MSDSKFKEWYKSNADDWNAKRRERYARDKKYRDTVLERNRDHRNDKKEELQEQATKERKARKSVVKDRWKTFEEDGKQYFSIGSVAESLRVSVQAVRLWERQGVIPPPAKRTKEGKGEGQRLYTQEDIEKIRKIVKKRLKHSDPKARNGVRGYVRDIRYASGKVKSETVYTVGVLAKAIPKTVVTLEHLEREEKLPATSLRGSSVKRRLYTLPMIEVVKSEFDKRPTGIRGAEAWREFYDAVHKGWKKLGVVGAELVND